MPTATATVPRTGWRTRQCTMALGMVCFSCVRTCVMYALTCTAILRMCWSAGVPSSMESSTFASHQQVRHASLVLACARTV